MNLLLIPVVLSTQPLTNPWHNSVLDQAIIAGLRDSVRDFSSNISDISSKDVLQLMLITQ